MKNKYLYHDNGYVTIFANGAGKYGWKITISEHSLKTVQKITNGHWYVVKKGNNHYVVTEKTIGGHTHKIWMHRAITGLAEYDLMKSSDPLLLPTLFTSPYGFSEKNPYHLNVFSIPYGNCVVDHRFIHDGLFNVDENLFIRARNQNSKSSLDHSAICSEVSSIFPDFFDQLTSAYFRFGRQEFSNDACNYYTDSLYTIANLENKETRIRLLQQCRNKIQSIMKTPIGKRTNTAYTYQKVLESILKGRIDAYDLYMSQDLSLQSLEDDLETTENELKSTSVLPNHYLIFLPYSEERVSRKTFTSHFGQDIITPGSPYTYYRPMVFDLTDHAVKVLSRSIKVHPCYNSFLPNSLESLDELNWKMQNASNMRLDTDLQGEMEIIANMTCEYGSDRLQFKPARVPKKYIKK